MWNDDDDFKDSTTLDDDPITDSLDDDLEEEKYSHKFSDENSEDEY